VDVFLETLHEISRSLT